MLLMFFISGLFVYPALRKHGTFRFIRDVNAAAGSAVRFCSRDPDADCLLCVVAMSQTTMGFLDFYKRLAAKGLTGAAVVHLGSALA